MTNDSGGSAFPMVGGGLAGLIKSFIDSKPLIFITSDGVLDYVVYTIIGAAIGYFVKLALDKIIIIIKKCF